MGCRFCFGCSEKELHFPESTESPDVHQLGPCIRKLHIDFFLQQLESELVSFSMSAFLFLFIC